MKIAIITDQHFGFKKGSKIYHDYFLKFYEEDFFPMLQREGITTVLDLGDTFDNRKGVDLYSLDWAKTHYFDRLRDMGISVVSVVGNHTAYYKNTNDINTIDLLLREYDNVRIVSQCEEINVGGLPILFIPWINNENRDVTYKEIKKTKAKVAMGHLELNGFVATQGHVMEHGNDIDVYQKFDRVLSGHFHTRSSNGKIYYIGNPYQMFWSDVNDPRGCITFDTETLEMKNVNNSHELYKVIKYQDTPRQLFKFSQYRDKIVKLVVFQKSKEKEFDLFLESLQKVNPIEIKIIERSEMIAMDDEIVQQTEDTMTLLNRYVDDLETELNKSRIKDILRTTYQQACEAI
jgi:DNA repair exonuclease SbcCD nuclease subunit